MNDMIDDDFLNENDINPDDVSRIQEEIINSIRNNDVVDLNRKYPANVIEHLCNDLVDQGRLGRVAKSTTSGIQFPYSLQ